MRVTFSTGSPDHGEKPATRARPLSITAVTPSMVTELSATLVERITLRRSAGATARSCSSGVRSPCSGRSSRSALAAMPLQAPGGLPDLRGAGQEHQHVAVEAFAEQALQRRRPLAPRAVGRGRRVGDVEVVEAALGSQDGAAAEERGDRRGFQGGRHDHQAQVGAGGPLQASQQRQGEVAFEVALVELVEDDHVDAAQVRVRQQPPRQHAFGEEAQPRARAGDLLEAHLVADGLAHPLAQLGGYAAGGQARGQPPRFEHQHLAGAESEQGGRDAGGFPCAGRRFENQVPASRRDGAGSPAAADRWAAEPAYGKQPW